jgi:type IV secretory pathway TrbD component
MTPPAAPAGLTPAWLTTALREASGESVTVAAVTSAPLAANQGFYGQLVRLYLTYEGESAGLPATLIAKFSSSNEAMRRRSIDSYQREVNFYRLLAPSTNLPTPRCYYAEIDPESGYHLLLLQDLTAIPGASAHSGSRSAGCTLSQAQLALHHIAQLHTTWWGKVGDSGGSELAWLPDPREHLDPQPMQAQYDEWWPLFYQQAKDQLPADLVPHSQTLGSHRAFLRHHIFGGAPRTLIHRDFQLDNLFFGASSGTISQAMPFAIVDWQFLSRGLGVWDIAYFLSESLLPADRRAEMELLNTYHQTLVEQGIDDYPFSQCLLDYRLALLQRHTALVSTIAAMPFSAEQRRLHTNILLPRNVAALVDHNAFALLE